VRAFCVYDGNLIVAGQFGAAGGMIVRNIVRWNGTNWSGLDGGINLPDAQSSAVVTELGTFNGELFAGGGFTSSGAHAAHGFARFTQSNIPWIALQPQNANATCIGTAAFNVTPATGYDNLAYQWRKDGEPLPDGMTKHGSTISGAQSASLSISNAVPDDAGDYDVIVSNDCGEAVSVPAALIVNHCGDLTGDGVVGVPDLLAVINGWGPCPALPTPCPADIAPPPDGDGTVGVPDLLLVINNWG
jgi:hypothetical protein